MFAAAFSAIDRLEAFCAGVERELSQCLRTSAIPDDRLVEAIAVAKVRTVEAGLEIQHQLESEVGSYALTSDSGFQYKDLLLCCKFAEGDSRVLKMKMARDRLERVRSRGVLAELSGWVTGTGAERAESYTALMLARAMDLARRAGGSSSEKRGLAMAAEWDRQWERVYGLADMGCARHMREAEAA